MDSKQAIELKDTAELMVSTDYKDRFKAELYQLGIRLYGLTEMIHKYETGTLPFTPKCSIETLVAQKNYMTEYLEILQVRAEIEGIEL